MYVTSFEEISGFKVTDKISFHAKKIYTDEIVEIGGVKVPCILFDDALYLYKFP